MSPMPGPRATDPEERRGKVAELAQAVGRPDLEVEHFDGTDAGWSKMIELIDVVLERLRG